MEENRESKFKEIAWLMYTITTLPADVKKALCWAVMHFDELTEMCDDPNIALENIPDLMAKAWEEGSYALFMLLCVTKMLKESEENKENGHGDP